jgi:hypothetical protein
MSGKAPFDLMAISIFCLHLTLGVVLFGQVVGHGQETVLSKKHDNIAEMSQTKHIEKKPLEFLIF